MQYVYLIQCQGYCKIGIANDVKSRLAQLSTGNPFPLELLGFYGFENAAPVESAVHQRFIDLKSRGEWFKLNDADIQAFHEICTLLGGKENFNPIPKIEEEEIDEAEEIDISLENIRTELRMSKGQPRGVVLVERGSSKNVVAYIGQENKEFEKYLNLYKQEHPNSRIFK